MHLNILQCVFCIVFEPIFFSYFPAYLPTFIPFIHSYMYYLVTLPMFESMIFILGIEML